MFFHILAILNFDSMIIKGKNSLSSPIKERKKTKIKT
jgi:hypothetical protein